MFVNALLLFLVQPMFAKLLLPRFGGSPAVWTTCMLFFQSALLAGYAYSHSLVKLRRPWQQAAVHLIVMSLPILTLPIAGALIYSVMGPTSFLPRPNRPPRPALGVLDENDLPRPRAGAGR